MNEPHLAHAAKRKAPRVERRLAATLTPNAHPKYPRWYGVCRSRTTPGGRCDVRHGRDRDVCWRGPLHIAMTSDRRRDSLIQRAAESLRKPERAERLGIALADLARELADARRQISALKRENAALRAQLAQRRGEEATPLRPPNRFQPGMGVGGRRGG